MLAAPLFLTTLALAPTGASSWIELTVGGEFDNEVITVPQQGTLYSNGGEGSVGFTLFSHPVFDDDAPPGLQPFLQRLSSLHVSGDFGGYSALPANGSIPSPGSGHGGGASLSGSVYADCFFYASLGLSFDDRTDMSAGVATPRIAIPLGISAGPRLADTLLTIGWSVAPTRIGDAGFQIPFWGNVNLQVLSVVGRALSLRGEVDLLTTAAPASSPTSPPSSRAASSSAASCAAATSTSSTPCSTMPTSAPASSSTCGAARGSPSSSATRSTGINTAIGRAARQRTTTGASST